MKKLRRKYVVIFILRKGYSSLDIVFIQRRITVSRMEQREEDGCFLICLLHFFTHVIFI